MTPSIPISTTAISISILSYTYHNPRLPLLPRGTGAIAVLYTRRCARRTTALLRSAAHSTTYCATCHTHLSCLPGLPCSSLPTYQPSTAILPCGAHPRRFSRSMPPSCHRLLPLPTAFLPTPLRHYLLLPSPPAPLLYYLQLWNRARYLTALLAGGLFSAYATRTLPFCRGIARGRRGTQARATTPRRIWTHLRDASRHPNMDRGDTFLFITGHRGDRRIMLYWRCEDICWQKRRLKAAAAMLPHARSKSTPYYKGSPSKGETGAALLTWFLATSYLYDLQPGGDVACRYLNADLPSPHTSATHGAAGTSVKTNVCASLVF